MRFIIIALIHFYQRVLSPRKGFSCAHHRLYGGHTCSNAVKELVMQNNFFASLPKIRQRFLECREASDKLTYSLHRSDIPCDLPCELGCDGFDLGGKGSKVCDLGYLPCDMFCGSDSGSKKYSKRQRFIALLCTLLVTFSFLYWFYGRGIAAIYVMPKGEGSGVSAKLWQRKTPDLRVLVKVRDKKVYSKIIHDVDLTSIQKPLKFVLKEAVFDHPDSIELHDARVKVGGDLLVAGEILESIQGPVSTVEGQRFRYVVKRRWSF